MAINDYSDEEDYYEQGFGKDGVVSIWAGLEGADERQADVLQDLCGVGYYNLDDQEANCFDFRLVDLRLLLQDMSYSISFIEQACAAATHLGIHQAKWITVQYDFDYQPTKVRRAIESDPVFLGVFSYVVK
ncbi:immunity 22 family protein [Undibacterium sp. Ji83W]|uniref:immunity 22 family protein n=1 Tax=Undibacterium sp. Ji83W TaxID=3413043 RepID=UPI003BF2EF79